ncbi:MAG: hypothetical protein ACR2MD_02775 [Aridibacter sp.]
MKNCKTCKWWITPAELHPHLLNDAYWKNHGECELLGRNGMHGNPRAPGPSKHWDWHEERLAATYGTGGSSDSGLITHSDFGCVQHEEIIRNK